MIVDIKLKKEKASLPSVKCLSLIHICNRIARQVVQVPIRSFSQLNENEEPQNEESWNYKLSRNKVNIYPNPVRTELVVSISELPEPGYGQLIMFDMEGQQMYKGDVTTTYKMCIRDRCKGIR